MLLLRRLNWYFRKRWPFYALTVVLITFGEIINLLPPKIIGEAIDSIRMNELTTSSLNQITLLLIAIAFCLYVNRFTWIQLLFGSAILVEKLLRDRLMIHLTKLKPSFYQRHRTGDLMALATNDISAIQQATGYGFLTLCSTVIGTAVVVTMMSLQFEWTLVIAALSPLPLLALSVTLLGKHMRIRFGAAQDAFGRMNDHALETITGVRVLRAYVQEQHDLNAFDRVTTDVMKENRKVAFVASLFEPLIQIIIGLSFTIGIGYGAYLVFHSEMTLGQLVTFNLYLGFLTWPMISFGEFINVFQRGSASADRIQRTLSAVPDVQDAKQPIVLDKPGTIVMDSLSFRYPESWVDALKNITFSLEPGQTLGIVGPTGSGKSTLLKQFLRQYPIESNRLYISDVPIEQLTLRQLSSWIGYVPQEHLILSKSIRDNLKLGAPDASEAEVERIVRLAYLEQDISQMQYGLGTVIGEQGVMLSGGQKQRIAIARALLADPEIVILDDSLSAVDARTERVILQNIRETSANRTTLIATHRLSAVAHADLILVLQDGQIVESGTHEQLMANHGWYRVQYDRQQLEQTLLDNE